MKSITSISGGKTSAYMALHYRTDLNVFACVLSEKESIKDKGLLKQIQDRIPNFVGSHEAESTLKVVLDLEQLLGSRIDWVSSQFTLEDYIQGKTDLPGYRNSSMLPNSQRRFCTQECKISPIFEYCFNSSDFDPVIMNIGFRYDEDKRVRNWKCENDKFRYAKSCNLNGKYNWDTAIDWRITNFPLHANRIDKMHVLKYWSRSELVFPEISNCLFCFHHTDIQLQRQKALYPEGFDHWNRIEKSFLSATFGKRSLEDITSQPLLNVFNVDSSCNCTD